jgi:hypothetical protein
LDASPLDLPDRLTPGERARALCGTVEELIRAVERERAALSRERLLGGPPAPFKRQPLSTPCQRT